MVIAEYNEHMGGADLLDNYIGRYRIPLQKRSLQQRGGISSSGNLNLWQFRQNVCLISKNALKKRVRPGATLEMALCTKGLAAHVELNNVRVDESSYWIKNDKNLPRRKLPYPK